MRDEILLRNGMTSVAPADYERALVDAWEAVDSLITRGALAEPAHSERNGIVLAANKIMALRLEANKNSGIWLAK